MNEKELYDKIEAYLREDLSAADKKAFDAEIASNPLLAEQVEMHRFEWDGMEVILENDLRAKMVQWQEEGKKGEIILPSVKEVKNRIIPIEKGKTTVRRLYYGLAIAASITLLLGALLWVFTKPNPISDVVKNDASKDTIARLPLPTPKSDKENTPIVQMDKKPIEPPVTLPKQESPKPIVPNNETNRVDETTYIAFAEDAYKEDVPDYESINTTRSGGNNVPLLEEAGKAYDSKDFTKVISLLKNTLALDENFNALELLAHSYFQQKQYKLALPLFKDLLRLSGKRTHGKSEWYLLLCYLTNYSHYKSEFAVLSQKILANSEHDYAAQTKTLLSKIQRH